MTGLWVEHHTLQGRLTLAVTVRVTAHGDRLAMSVWFEDGEALETAVQPTREEHRERMCRVSRHYIPRCCPQARPP